MPYNRKPSLHSGRVECPTCHRKGVGYANKPDGKHKDYSKAKCRYCKAAFSPEKMKR